MASGQRRGEARSKIAGDGRQPKQGSPTGIKTATPARMTRVRSLARSRRVNETDHAPEMRKRLLGEISASRRLTARSPGTHPPPHPPTPRCHCTSEWNSTRGTVLTWKFYKMRDSPGYRHCLPSMGFGSPATIVTALKQERWVISSNWEGEGEGEGEWGGEGRGRGRRERGLGGGGGDGCANGRFSVRLKTEPNRKPNWPN